MLIDVFGWQGAALQRGGAILSFGLVLFPFTVLLLVPAWRRVPRGPHDAARLLGGPRLALRLVTVRALMPALVGAFLLTFGLALADFAVPDVLGFMLPGGGAPAHTFAADMLLQWKQEGNVARAAATALPYLALTLTLVALGLLILFRSGVASGEHQIAVQRARRPVGTWHRVGATLAWVGLLVLALGVPFYGIAQWAGGRRRNRGAGKWRSAASRCGLGHAR